MTRQKIGKFVFWIGVVCMLAAYIGLWVGNPIHRGSTPAELEGSTWSSKGLLFIIRGQIQILGIFLPLIGALVYSGKKKSLFWLWGLVPMAAFLSLVTFNPTHIYPALYGAGGGIMVLCYLGILWSWLKTYKIYEGKARTGRHIQLLGFSFLFVTSLFLCLYIGQPYLKGIADLPRIGGESLLITFTAAWVLLAVGQYISGKEKNK
jgi:drug/metabolite transporter superfamily protein YnfA